MAAENDKTKKKKQIMIGIGTVILILIMLFLIYIKIISDIPTLTVETPQRIRISENEEFILDVTISDLGNTLYPAASVSISFDSSRLEFIGVEEGNVFVHSDKNAAGEARKLPEWSCNPEVCNETGMINIMYLDMTGGRYAFSKELLAEEDNVLLRLHFRIRGSVRPGDVCELILEDAVFAASDEKHSHAMTRGTLRGKNGRIVVGE